jgi:hypothetical protein
MTTEPQRLMIEWCIALLDQAAAAEEIDPDDWAQVHHQWILASDDPALREKLEAAIRRFPDEYWPEELQA